MALIDIKIAKELIDKEIPKEAVIYALVLLGSLKEIAGLAKIWPDHVFELFARVLAPYHAIDLDEAEIVLRSRTGRKFSEHEKEVIKRLIDDAKVRAMLKLADLSNCASENKGKPMSSLLRDEI